MWLHVPILKRAALAAPRIRSHAINSLAVYDRLRQEDPASVRQTLFTKVFDAGEDGNLSFEEIVANAQAYVIAGTDTTSTTLTYLVWCVCSRPALRDALVQELSSVSSDLHDSDLKALPLLNNIINETLRLYTPTSSALPREVPTGGATLAGHWIPEGTTVACQAYSLHRDPSIWPDPETYNPSRWEDPTKEMLSAFMPFGAGARSK
jgi:cytochrome P450